MLGFGVSALVLVLHLGLGCAITLPLNLTNYAPSSMASNLTAWPFPPDFNTQLAREPDIILNPLAIYLNAINVVSRLAVQDQRKTWKVSHWTLPEYNVWISLAPSAASGTPSALQTRFALWGIVFGMFSIAKSKQYNPLTVELFWKDVHVGEVYIRLGPPPTLSIAATRPPRRNPSIGDSSRRLNATEDLSSVADLGESFNVFTNYNGATLNSEEVFLTVLVAMEESAHKGADSRCPWITVAGSEIVRFHIRSEEDQYGNVLLRYRHVVRLARKVAFKMVSDRRFAEMIFVLEIDGVKTAQGTFKKVRLPHADALNGIQITR